MIAANHPAANDFRADIQPKLSSTPRQRMKNLLAEAFTGE
jgi:hypothetical protein